MRKIKVEFLKPFDVEQASFKNEGDVLYLENLDGVFSVQVIDKSTDKGWKELTYNVFDMEKEGVVKTTEVTI